MSDGLISIVLPVYNQADHIRDVVQEYETALARVQTPHELLLVVNGSRDNSLTVCEELARQFEPVRAIHTAKGGWGLAVRLGLEESKGETLCYTNSARTSAQDLSLLLVYAMIFPDVVVKANRKIRDNWLRRLGSLLYNLECRALFDISNWDINGTPKVFPRRFNKLLQLTRDDDLLDMEFNVICRNEGYPMIEVPVYSTLRHGGSSTTSLRSAIKLYSGAFRWYWRWRTRSE